MVREQKQKEKEARVVVKGIHPKMKVVTKKMVKPPEEKHDKYTEEDKDQIKYLGSNNYYGMK